MDTGRGPSQDGKPAAPQSDPPQQGLRERKKQRTRMAIYEAAMALFAERGYDHVTMAEIARAADVAPATVFTHYASKEDLVYELRHVANDRLRVALGSRAAEVGVLTAVKEWQLAMYEYYVESPEKVKRSRTFALLLRESPTLWTRSVGFVYERQKLLTELMLEHYPQTDPFLLEVAAAQIAGAVQASQGRYQGDLAAGMDRTEILARAAERAEQAFEQLARGLGDVL
ncbi:TetR/AcrR family transcriptional regulator [Catenulispora sp. NF23]|uniref:TetR/AcrR family transcriptional regulator n=1 Tax=Catenulispora pinistramenti TaxID=2705254 RepID=A0ABS5L827_9ACTN|nr:TetR/AcrR family transcriptional regulator [Catenulispora pinistramenti]MBS2539721.1 TetR/AcrR family transcriptional regulator [Catenulispora pinistramenti]MBS2554488.1 TetR/AcrR family transcriptional regulator [Catenulispora pinistramenti]